MRDMTGRKLKGGDAVVTTFSGQSSVIIGRIIGFTLEKVRVEVAGGKYCLRLPSQICYLEKSL